MIGRMQTLPSQLEMFGALLRRDRQYEGIFIVGVKTTGVCCRPTCSARKPHASNVEYFANVQDALVAGYRPCRRCRPLEPAGATPGWLRALLDEVEADPVRRWRDGDLRALGAEPARVRRWFLREHGMTFHAYQRSRRLGAALGRIRQGADLTGAGYDAGFESSSGFRDAFHKVFGAAPGRSRGTQPILVTRIPTPLGAMLAAASDTALCLLEFADRRMLQTQITRLQRYLDARFTPGENHVLAATRQQLGEYFAGSRREFDLPLAVPGTRFQQEVWSQLQTIPYGTTRSYAEQARVIRRPEAIRAVGKANGDNRIAIVIPCHRVVGADGQLTGYGGQLWRKKALLDLEARTLAGLPDDGAFPRQRPRV